MVVHPGAVKVFAFLLRALRRAFGSQRVEYRTNIAERSRRYLQRLDGPVDSWSVQTALEDLRIEPDLLDEDAANEEDGLKLQLIIHTLAKESSRAQLLIEVETSCPMHKLFFAMVAQGQADGASVVRVTFPSDGEHQFDVHYFIDQGWVQAMTIPRSLALPLSGMVKRVRGLGYEAWRELNEQPDKLPSQLEFAWISPTELQMNLLQRPSFEKKPQTAG